MAHWSVFVRSVIKRGIAGALTGGVVAAVAYSSWHWLFIGAVRISDGFYVGAVSFITISSTILAGLIASARLEPNVRIVLCVIGLILLCAVSEAYLIAEGRAAKTGATVLFLSILAGSAVGQLMRRRHT